MNIDFRIRGGNFFALALVVMAWIAGAARAEVDVVSWGQPNYDQADLRGPYSQITAGGYHTVALKSDSTVVAWGHNNYSQCTVPVGLSGVTQVAAGGYHTLALKNDGTVVAWGRNSSGQCTVPAGLAGVTQIAAGFSRSVALNNDGTVVVWGYDFGGLNTVPAGLSGVTQIAAGEKPHPRAQERRHRGCLGRQLLWPTLRAHRSFERDPDRSRLEPQSRAQE